MQKSILKDQPAGSGWSRNPLQMVTYKLQAIRCSEACKWMPVENKDFDNMPHITQVNASTMHTSSQKGV